MKSESFSFLWENAVINCIDIVYNEISEEYRNEYHLEKKNTSSDMENVKKLYEQIRDYVKDNFFDKGSDGKNLMDVHKIAACLTSAIVKYRLFKYDYANEIPKEVLYCNYAVAFLTGLNVMYISRLSDLSELSERSEEDNNKFEYFFRKGTFTFPETTDGHDEYVQGRIKTLAANDLNGIDFDILTYADMLFWIEHYNLHYDK